MRINLLFTLVLITLVSLGLNAQAKKFVLYEHFTQASCGPCATQNPAFKNGILDVFEGKIHHISYHTSWPGFDPMYNAAPAPADTRVAYYNVTGVPDMILNGTTIGGPAAASAADIAAADATTAPISVDVKETEVLGSRTVDIDVATVGTVPAGSYLLQAFVVERNVDYASAPGSNGETSFPNVMRAQLTATNGDAYSAAAIGSATSFSYTYALDPAWDPSQIYVIAFVQSVTKAVLNSGSSFDPTATVSNGSGNYHGGASTITVDASSNTPANADFNVEVITDAPADWSSEFTFGGNTYSSAATVQLPNATADQIAVNVTPGATPAIGTYTLQITDSSNPNAFPESYRFKVMSGVRDLIIDQDGSYSIEAEFNTGLDQAGNTEKAIGDLADLEGFSAAGALSDVYNIYYNGGWSYPVFSDNGMTALGTFLDNGGNLMITGQDIGWQTWDNANSSYANATTQAFYTDYLQANWLDDGQAAWTSFVAEASDPIFGTTATSVVFDFYGQGAGSFWPDQIEPATADGNTIFWYDAAQTISGGIKVDNGVSKVVYLGIGVEMIGNATIRRDIIATTHDWFYSGITSIEFDEAIANAVAGDAFPNPAADFTNIEFIGLDKDVTLQLVDASGKILLDTKISSGTELYTLKTADLTNGVYFCRILNQNQLINVKKLIVNH